MSRKDLYTEYNAEIGPGHSQFFVCDFSTASTIRKSNDSFKKFTNFYCTTHMFKTFSDLQSILNKLIK